MLSSEMLSEMLSWGKFPMKIDGSSATGAEAATVAAAHMMRMRTVRISDTISLKVVLVHVDYYATCAASIRMMWLASRSGPSRARARRAKPLSLPHPAKQWMWSEM